MLDFRQFVQVPPINLLHMQPATYMLIVGIVEVLCAVVIVLGNYQQGKLATWALLVMMTGAIYTLYSIHHPAPNFVPACIALGLILVRLYTMGALDQVQVKVKI